MINYFGNQAELIWAQHKESVNTMFGQNERIPKERENAKKNKETRNIAINKWA